MAKGDHERGKGLAIGAAIGAVGGVIAGLLFAPKSGKETRQDIKDAAGSAKERFEVEGKKLHGELNELVDKGEARAKDAGEKLSGKAKEVVDQAKHSRDSLVTLAKSVKAGKADDKDLDKAIQAAKKSRDALAKYLKK